MNSPVVFIFYLHICSCVSWKETDCISNYQELKASLRSNLTDNVHKLLGAFYPPNQSSSHSVLVHYCERKNFTIDPDTDEFLDQNCDYMSTEHRVLWLTSSLFLLIDLDVFRADTFYLADLHHLNLSLTVNPFCNDTDGPDMLLTLTAWVSMCA